MECMYACQVTVYFDNNNLLDIPECDSRLDILHHSTNTSLTELHKFQINHLKSKYCN